MNATMEHIWHEFAGKLGRFIRTRVADPAAAEDILQDVFLRIQKRLDQLKDPAKLETWIYLIARNAVVDHYRTRRETVEVPETMPSERDRLGISLSGAKSRVQRGRAQLKKMLDECCTFEFDRRGAVIGCEPRKRSSCEECA